MTRLTNLRLGEIALSLSDRDREILRLFQKLGFIRSVQIRRLYYYGTKRPATARKNTTELLHRLERNELIACLSKRSGGTGGGSDGIIWHLTEAGHRLLALEAGDCKRKRFTEPSQTFLKHTLAVTETFVQITEICRMSGNVRISRLETEPDCWREYTVNGKTVLLRPDLYAEIENGRFSDFYFIEIDLGTESMNRVMEKTKRYYDYYASRQEQQTKGTFPAVIWLVQTPERKELIEKTICSRSRDSPKLSQVITPNRLWTLINDGVAKDEMC